MENKHLRGLQLLILATKLLVRFVERKLQKKSNAQGGSKNEQEQQK